MTSDSDLKKSWKFAFDNYDIKYLYPPTLLEHFKRAAT